MRNPFATKARKLHRLIIPRRDFIDHALEPGKILEVLDRIVIPEGKALRCHLIDSSRHCIGDNSFLYVSDRDVPEDESKSSYIDDIWKNINVEPSAMGMWQAYLLMTTIHVMPFIWHGGYNERKFIFSPSDLKRISALRGKDISHIKEADLQPEVIFNEWLDNEYMGMVSCTYWTEWGGLVRETIIIILKENRITDYGPEINKVLFKYNCGICY